MNALLLLVLLLALAGCATQSGHKSSGMGKSAGADPEKPMLLFYQCKNLPEYPRSAMEKNQTGVTVIAFVVEPSGIASSGEIRKSSGHELLDNLALSTLANCPFSPARKAGVAVRAEAEVTYVWKIR